MTKQSMQPAIYILASKKNGTMYVGVTSNLIRRIFEHKNNITIGFAEKYGCKSLVYFEILDDMENAILREKQLKAGSRQKKIDLIENQNPDWLDLYNNII